MGFIDSQIQVYEVTQEGRLCKNIIQAPSIDKSHFTEEAV